MLRCLPRARSGRYQGRKDNQVNEVVGTDSEGGNVEVQVALVASCIDGLQLYRGTLDNPKRFDRAVP